MRCKLDTHEVHKSNTHEVQMLDTYEVHLRQKTVKNVPPLSVIKLDTHVVHLIKEGRQEDSFYILSS